MLMILVVFGIGFTLLALNGRSLISVAIKMVLFSIMTLGQSILIETISGALSQAYLVCCCILYGFAIISGFMCNSTNAKDELKLKFTLFNVLTFIIALVLFFAKSTADGIIGSSIYIIGMVYIGTILGQLMSFVFASTSYNHYYKTKGTKVMDEIINSGRKTRKAGYRFRR